MKGTEVWEIMKTSELHTKSASFPIYDVILNF